MMKKLFSLSGAPVDVPDDDEEAEPAERDQSELIAQLRERVAAAQAEAKAKTEQALELQRRCQDLEAGNARLREQRAQMPAAPAREPVGYEVNIHRGGDGRIRGLELFPIAKPASELLN